MKANRIILQLSFVVMCFVANAQSTFEIVSVGTQYNQEIIQQAFTNANFCGYYFESKRNQITLNDGSVVELKSAQELTGEGNEVSESCIKSETDRVYDWIWSIDPSGVILKGFDTEKYSSEKEYIQYINNTNQ